MFWNPLALILKVLFVTYIMVIISLIIACMQFINFPFFHSFQYIQETLFYREISACVANSKKGVPSLLLCCFS